MKANELEQLVKVYVRKALNEVLAEKYIQTIIKEAVSESLKHVQVLQEAPKQQPQVKQERTAAPKSRKIVEDVSSSNENIKEEKALRNLGVKDPLMEAIFRDTLASGNPLVTGEESPGVEVPESALEQIGVFDKDWSKFVP